MLGVAPIRAALRRMGRESQNAPKKELGFSASAPAKSPFLKSGNTKGQKRIILLCERAAFPLCEVFTDDSSSRSQDRRCTLRIGKVPLCASSWRRAARSVFYYESGGGEEEGSLLSGTIKNLRLICYSLLVR
ncbi:hypothetical protein NQZ68_036165 [Dissostichus eleginoides]|nr:hypothetical protein NQZ68_036165 [Dissostichus eleginoides]